MCEVTLNAEAACETIIEEHIPLSLSKLWRLQRNFYEEQGKNAWEGKVPYFATSNAYMAKAYAHVILGYLQDCNRSAIDGAQPIHIVEIGSGAGIFSYRLIKKLQTLKLVSPFALPAFRYVMTDFTQKNIDFWRGHPALQPFIKNHLLDFALFDAEKDNQLLLQESGFVLTPETNNNPVIAIANYVFDSLLQDVFRFEAGDIKEGLVTLFTTESTAPDKEKPMNLDQFKVRYNFETISNDYYQDSEFNEILNHYHDRLCDTTICFPIGALRCIRNLLHLSRNKLFLLSSDKGQTCEQDLLGQMAPTPVTHEDCFSMMVNYHAIARYFHHKENSLCRLKKSYDGFLCISGFVSGEASHGYPATEFAFAEHIESFGPVEFFYLNDTLQELVDFGQMSMPLRAIMSSSHDNCTAEKIPLRTLLSIIRHSEFDTRVFGLLSDAILEALNDVSKELETELFQVLECVWDNIYYMENSRVAAENISEIYYKCHRYTWCIETTKKIMNYYGENATLLNKVGACLYKLNMKHEALRYFYRAHETDKNLN